MGVDISNLLVGLETPIRQVIEAIERGVKGIALIVDDERHLIGTITDGDIRRALLAGIDLNEQVSLLLKRKKNSIYPEPIAAPVDSDTGNLLKIMQEKKIQQVPLLDKKARVVDIVTLDELIPGKALPIQAVVMAGGFGTRLKPITDDVPKPMLPVGDRPLIEHIIESLRDVGIRQVSVATHYKHEKIAEYFRDGSDFGMNIQYVQEDRPLGTAGALGLMKRPDETVLVINGDILTRVDFRSMLRFHREHNARLTMGVRQYDIQVPYGVVQTEGALVCDLKEKPSLNFFINAGLYLLEPDAFEYIPAGQIFDMTDLIKLLLANGQSIASYPIVEYWLDIGQADDYQQAQNDN